MRIGYWYNFNAYPPRGGNHVHAFELTKNFLELGHSVAVVNDPSMPGTTNFGNNEKELGCFIDNIDILYARIDGQFTRYNRFFTKCVFLAGNKRKPIVLEINAPSDETLAYSWLGGKTLCKRKKKEGWFRQVRRWIHANRKRFGIVLEENHRRSLAQFVSGAICVSSALGRYAADELGIANVLVLPNGGPLIPEEEIQLRRMGRKPNNFTVLYSGSTMYPWQGLEYLYDVIELAEHESSDISFVLAVNQRTDDLPSSKNVIVLEGLNREEIIDVICAADACVSIHPEYTWTKYGFHNSPMKLFEYMACMKPTLATNIGQMREILRDGEDAILCTNDPLEILRKLEFLRDHPSQALRIGRHAWCRIQQGLNWKVNAEKSIQFFMSFGPV